MIKNTLLVSICIFISRILGYIRDSLLAKILGASTITDLFFIALRIPNLFRSILGEGAFNATFTPTFSSILKKEGIEQAKLFAQNIQTGLLLCLIFLTTVMFGSMDTVITIIAPGLNVMQHDIARDLSRITIFYLPLISIVIFYGSILNSNAYYFPFAFSSVIMNVILIIGIILPLSFFDYKIYLLAVCVFLSGMLECIWILFFAKRYKLLIPIAKLKNNIQLLGFIHRFSICALNSGINQINLLIPTILASKISHAISYLYYADRISQLPLAIIGTALGTTIMPDLSKYFAANNLQEISRLNHQALNIGMLFAIPAAFGIFNLNAQIVDLLLGYGNFNAQAVLATAQILKILAIAIPSFIITKVLSSLLYATQDTKASFKISIICIIANIITVLSLINKYSFLALPIGHCLSSWINSVLLLYVLYRKNVYKISLRLLLLLLIYISCSIIMIYLFDILHLHILLTIITCGVIYLLLVALLTNAFKHLII